MTQPETYSLDRIIRLHYPYSYNRVKTRVDSLCSTYPHLTDKDVLRIISQSKTCDGELVGIIAGQSLGERVTQLTLNTFHSAGMTEDTVSTGVPRVIELLNLTHVPKFSSRRKVSLKLHAFDKSDRQQVYTLFKRCERRLVSRSIKCVLVSKWYRSYKHEWWYVSGEKYDSVTTFIMQCDESWMIQLGITLDEIRHVVEQINDIPYLRVDISPWSIQQVHIHTTSPSILFGKWSIIEQYPIRGIPYCTAYTLHPESDNLQCIGCHLSQFIGTQRVNLYQSHSNDVWEMFTMFGIECVRNFIISEICSIVDNIQLHHAILIVDVMTWNGVPTPLNRFGIHDINTSILSKCTFERPINIIVDGSCKGHNEDIISASASVMCGTMGTYGTGSVHLKLPPNFEQ